MGIGWGLVACGLRIVEGGGGALDDGDATRADDDATTGPRDDVQTDDTGRGDDVDADGVCPPSFVRGDGDGGDSGTGTGICIDEAARSFTLAANPSGNWTWSYRLDDASAPVTKLPIAFVHDAQAGLHAWTRVVGTLEPAVFFNAKDASVNAYGSFTMQAFELAFHPGALNERAVIRWTAPATNASTSYAVTVVVRGLSGLNASPPTTTGITIAKNNQPLAVALLPLADASSGPRKLEIPASTFQKGDVLDVLLDFGPNGNYGFDSTGVNVTVQSLAQ